MPRPSPEERFWQKVHKTEECWLWVGACRPDGYGQFWLSKQYQHKRPHQFAYELLRGPVPEGQELDHKTTCPKNCVNPDHLRPTTRKQNQENRAGAQRNNLSSGVRGVTWNKREKKWIAKVQHSGRWYSAGYFPLDQLDRAEAAVIALRKRLFTHNDLDRDL